MCVFLLKSSSQLFPLSRDASTHTHIYINKVASSSARGARKLQNNQPQGHGSRGQETLRRRADSAADGNLNVYAAAAGLSLS